MSGDLRLTYLDMPLQHAQPRLANPEWRAQRTEEQVSTTMHDNHMPQSTGSTIIAARQPLVRVDRVPRSKLFPCAGLTDPSISQAFRAYKSLHQERRRVKEAMASGPSALVKLLLDFERTHRQFSQEHLDDIASHMFVILMATDNQILNHHRKGDFVAYYIQDDTFRQIIDDMERRALAERDGRPTVYRCTLAHQDGHGHTINELDQCLHLLERYLEDTLDSSIIRSLTKILGACPGTEEEDEDRLRSVLRKKGPSSDEAIQAFITNTRRRLLQDSAFDSPLSYVGISTSPAGRQHTHQNHPNGIMALVYAISNHLFSMQFKIFWHPLFLCFEPGQIGPGEILFERLGCGLAATGGGFAIAPAGNAINKMKYYTAHAWAEWTAQAMRHTPYHHKLQEYRDSTVGFEKARERLYRAWRPECHTDRMVEQFGTGRWVRVEDTGQGK